MAKKQGRIFYGWWIVLACAMLNFLNGGTFYYGFTVFFNPIKQAFGWTSAATSVAFTFQRIESGIAGPVTGFLVDRVGPRKLMVAGWITVAIGFFWVSRIDSLWEFYIAFLLLSIGFSFGSFVVINATIANWFTRKRSRAMTLHYAGYGASGLLVPILAMVISNIGWRDALVWVSAICLVAGVPLSLLLRHKPQSYGYLPDGATPPPDGSRYVPQRPEASKSEVPGPAPEFTTLQAVKTRTFWLLCLSYFFQQIGVSSIAVHIVPYLESVNISTAIAASTVTGVTVCSLVGRLGFGFLGDYRSKRHLIAISFTLQAVGIFIFSLVDASRMWLIIVFLAIYAPGYGGPLPLRQALQADYFGTKSFGTTLGLISLISMFASLASPVVAGWAFDVTGSYRLVWQIFAYLTVPAIPLIFFARPVKPKEMVKYPTG